MRVEDRAAIWRLWKARASITTTLSSGLRSPISMQQARRRGPPAQASRRQPLTAAGELKTTTPYQPGFSANQKQTIAKDLVRLAASAADHRFMFVTDPDCLADLPRIASASAFRRGKELVRVRVVAAQRRCPRAAPPFNE